MKRNLSVSICSIILLSFLLVIGGCSGSGKGGSTSGGSGTTVVSGKVTLSSSITQAKPSFAPVGAPGSKTYRQTARFGAGSSVLSKLFATGDITPLSGATVDLYDADHPEWLFPVSSGSTDSNGEYTLSTMSNAAKNQNATYQDGDPIPAGNYTLVASKGGIGQKPVVAVQTIISEFSGQIPNVKLEAIDSDVAPAVISIVGLGKNKDGSQTWGSASKLYPKNAAIQLVFSMPMVREYLSAISIKSTDGGTVPTGKWSLSADWLTATYYLDAGQEMTLDKTYTVTIYGDDDTGNHAKAVNVYGNPCEKTAVGTFKASAADSLSPTVQWNSPTVIQMGNKVDVNQTFRVESNEILDVNGIRLIGSPSIGVKPGVVFLGKNNSGLYVYEFVLGKPLNFDQSYMLTVTGGKDLAGHAMNNLSGSITTWDAASTVGIDPAAGPEKQYLQAEVKAVFEKWVRSMNDRNLAQFQRLMSPEFYLEYDPSRGIDATTDVNRDGRWSISEFTKMFANRAFPQWDYCGTTINGIIAPTAGTYINVYPLTETADFEFKLTATNTINSQQCSDTAPRETFYATLQFKNGAWKMVRASSGIDTRDKPISSPDVILTELHQLTGNLIVTDVPIADGGKLDEIPDNPSTTPQQKKYVRAKFQWTAVQGVQSYLVIIGDLRHQGIGRAYAFPSSVTNIATDEQWDVNSSGLGTDVTSLFFQGQGGPGGPQALGDPNDIVFYEGGRYFWEVIGLSTIKPTDVPNMSLAILLKDISHTSALRNFGVTGLYRELEILLRPGTNPTAAPVAYSELFNGYDVGTAFQVTLTLYNPNLTAGGWINSWGSQYWNDLIAFDSAGMSSKVITLFKGWNWVYLCADGDWMANPPVPSLCKNFGIYTKGGKPPVIGVWEVIDDIGNTLAGDSSDFYKASAGAKKVTINGGVSDPAVAANGLYINLYNNELFASGSMQVPVTCDLSSPPNCTFSALVNIYKGNNWISLNGSGNTNYYTSNIGVNTDTGSVWVPPISITGFTGTNGTPTLKAKYPNSADWDVDPGLDYVVNVVGKFKNPGNGYYYFYSQSQAGNGNNGTISSSGDGSFAFPIILYQGWNNVSIYDNNYMNWYGLNIYALNGKVVIYPRITLVEGLAYNNSGSYTVNDCDVSISGTAMKGPLYVYWNAPGYSEQVSIQSTAVSGQTGTYTFTMPVLSNSYNYIDIYDVEWKWVGMSVYTNAANCTYTSPQVTFGGVKNAGGTNLPYVPSSYQADSSVDTVTIYGTTNRKERTITASMWTCGGNEIYSTQAASTLNSSGTYSWSIPGVKVYGGGSGLYNDIYVTDGYYFGQNVSVYSLNSVPLPEAPFRIETVTASLDGLLSPTYSGCSYQEYGTGIGTGNNTITISGVSDMNGTGYYIDQLGSNKSFDVTSGAFSITVPVYDQWNSFHFVDPGMRMFDIFVYTTNGIAKPKFVTITSPQHNATSVTGLKTVTAVVSDPVGAGFTPTEIWAYAYDSSTGISKSFTNNTANCPSCSTLTYSGSNISFNYDFGTSGTTYKYVEVYAYDSVRQISHLHGIYVNNQYGYGENSWKPGKAGNAGLYRERALSLEKMKRQQYYKSKSK